MLKKESNLKQDFGRALLVGTVRDGEKYCKKDVQRLLGAIEQFIPVVCFIVESDSSDNTVQILEDLSTADKRVRFVSLGRIEGSIPNRLERLKYCRNEYIQELRNNPEYQDCGLIVVADLDGINIRKGDKLYVMLFESTGCPFSDAATLPFGHGKHLCPGADLSRLILRQSMQAAQTIAAEQWAQLRPSTIQIGRASAFLAYEG